MSSQTVELKNYFSFMGKAGFFIFQKLISIIMITLGAMVKQYFLFQPDIGPIDKRLLPIDKFPWLH